MTIVTPNIRFTFLFFFFSVNRNWLHKSYIFSKILKKMHGIVSNFPKSNVYVKPFSLILLSQHSSICFCSLIKHSPLSPSKAQYIIFGHNQLFYTGQTCHEMSQLYSAMLKWAAPNDHSKGWLVWIELSWVLLENVRFSES